MQKETLIFSVLLISALEQVGAQTFAWAKRMGGITVDEGRSIATDGSGNAYIVGVFEDSVDFDPDTSVFNLISSGSTDIFIQKLGASGNLAWAKKIGGASVDQGNSIAIHSSGNIYITGNYIGTVDFDPGSGTSTLSSMGGSADIFLARYDTAGNFVWAKSIGGTLGDNAYGIEVDSAQNLYLTGYFRNVADFNPDSVAVANRTSSGGSPDAFVAKYGPTGNFIWANGFGGSMGDEGQALAVDDSGNVTVTGSYRSTVDFDPDTGSAPQTSIGASDIFIANYGPAGNYRWAKSIGGGMADDVGYSLVVDGAGNSYTTGVFTGNVDFDPGTATMSNLLSTGADAFILKLDASGNFGWANRTGGVNDDGGYALALDAAGNLYSTGYATGTVDFNPGTAIFNLFGAGLWDVFVQKLDTSGGFVWAARMGGNDFDASRAIAVGGSGNVFTTGWFSGTADFNPDSAAYTLTSAGNHDIFVHKMGAQLVGIRREKTFMDRTKWKRIFGSVFFWSGRNRDALGRSGSD